MPGNLHSLNKILRAQLTAVNQQFVHVLALRRWGLVEAANKIMQVDRNDFPVAMKFIDLLVTDGTPIHLSPDMFEPGSCEASVLKAEQRVEKRLVSALMSVEVSDERAAQLVNAAMAPRLAYAAWISERLGEIEPSRRTQPVEAAELSHVFSCLIALIEQAMIHAFVHWHHEEKQKADAAWMTSGAAMTHSARLTHLLADLHAAPIQCAPLEVHTATNPDDAIRLDRQLAGICKEHAVLAAQRSDGEIAITCSEIGDYAERLSVWESGQDHPAAGTLSSCFSSFECSLRKFARR